MTTDAPNGDASTSNGKSHSSLEGSSRVERNGGMDLFRTHLSRQQRRQTSSSTLTNSEKICSSMPTKRRSNSRFFLLLQTLIFDIPLVTLFTLFLIVYGFGQLHEDYFVPFLEAAERNDEHLSNEFTYYDRTCNADDISTTNLSDLIISQNSSTVEAVDVVRKHGAAVLPRLLSQNTITTLREFIVRQSNSLPAEKELPVSQGRNRRSFTLDATEDPILSVALEEIASHPQLKPLMEGLLGPDPALSELSPIIAFFGCPAQVWHADVKVDGSPFKFARTYVQSYTVFIPLQDTTREMGATDLLPGTHYCNDADSMELLCEKYGLQVNEASPDGIWHSGDAAIISQQAWHRGAAHRDPLAPERILFTVTFLPRPDLTHDRRQLSRGTYFHMKWNMWGHTFEDMHDAHASMAKPFSILRCLGVWKPKDRKYGFDFITSSALRMANNEDGACVEDLPVFVNQFVSKLGIPEFLQGPVGDDRYAWTTYLRETFQKCGSFLTIAVGSAHAIHLALVVVLALLWKDRRIVTGTILRMAYLHGLVLLLYYLVMKGMKKTTFATDIATGRMLLRFPNPTNEVIVEGAVTSGRTTAPQRTDVLVGSRYDARFLRGFDRFLDFHPGNEAYTRLVSLQAPYFKSYVGLPKTFADGVIQLVVSSMMPHGRFVQQDYRSGEWRVMSDEEGLEYTRVALLAQGSKARGVVQQEIAYLLAEYRFGLQRETRLADESQRYLYHWKRNLLFPRTEALVGTSSRNLSNPPTQAMKLQSQLRNHRRQRADIKDMEPRRPQNARWTRINIEDSYLNVGEVVFSRSRDSGWWMRGKIVKIRAYRDEDISYDIEFDDGTVRLALRESNIRPYSPVEEGSQLWVDWEESGEYFSATVLRVHPSLEVDVEYEDGGEYEEAIPYWLYAPKID